jgi:hypothetical protein
MAMSRWTHTSIVFYWEMDDLEFSEWIDSFVKALESEEKA